LAPLSQIPPLAQNSSYATESEWSIQARHWSKSEILEARSRTFYLQRFSEVGTFGNGVPTPFCPRLQ